jgi:hypothetical protein
VAQSVQQRKRVIGSLNWDEQVIVVEGSDRIARDKGHSGLNGLRALNDSRQSFGLPERADGGEVSREAMVRKSAVDVGFWPKVRGHHLLQPNLVFLSAHSDVLLHREMVLAFGVDYGRLA